MKTLILFLTLVLPVALSPAVSVDGANIHFSVYQGGPKTVIFVHGWTCDETSWQEQIPALGQAGYRMITMDLPGHGKSGAPTSGALTMDLFARAIEAVRVEAKAGKVVLVGHSMGTPVILNYAHLFPANVAGLVPVDGGLALRNGAANTDFLKGADGRKNRESMIRGMFSKSTTPEMQQHILQMMLGPSESMAAQAMATMSGPSPWSKDAMTFPVLGLYADHSGAVSEADFKKQFPNGKRVEIAGTGHFLMLEKPSDFNKQLMAFLATVKF